MKNALQIIGIVALLFLSMGAASADGCSNLTKNTENVPIDVSLNTATVVTSAGNREAIVLKYINPVKSGRESITTIQLNIEMDCIQDVYDGTGTKWTVSDKQTAKMYGDFSTEISRKMGDTDTPGPVYIVLKPGCDSELQANEDGYIIAVHVQRLGEGAEGSTWVTCGGNNQEIPEFPTIALPLAAIIGLAFIFGRRK